MPRIVITQDEKWPVYGILPADPEILAAFPNAGVEVDQAFIDEYEHAEAAWDAVQGKLGDLSAQRDAGG